MSTVIGIDLDGILVDYEGAFRNFVAEWKGQDPGSIPPASDWNFSTWPISSHQEFLDLHNMAVTYGLFFYAEPIPGAVDAIKSLSKDGYRIRIISHRFLPRSEKALVLEDTGKWLAKHEVYYDDLCFIEDKTSVNCDVLVDDAPHHLSNHSVAVTLAYEYNKSVSCPRFETWADIVDWIEKNVTV